MTIIIDGDKGIINATWTTGNRPASPAAGQRGYNSTLNQMEVYIGTGWVAMGERFSGKGGTITTSGDYTIHTFTSSGVFTPIRGNIVDYLVVGGGGAGGKLLAGGGGAGGFLTAEDFDVTAENMSITIGAGGAALTGNGNGNDGSDSVFSTITSTGGGGGGQYGTNGVAGRVGGSGGGGAGAGGGADGQGDVTQGGAGTANTGGGGGAGGSGTNPGNSGAGGSGIVIIRYLTQEKIMTVINRIIRERINNDS